MNCFLSHNSKDKPVAEEIGKALLPHGINCWLDKWEIFAGESLTGKIEEGVRNSQVFIILMSPNSMKARWVKEELRMALQRRIREDDFKLIPILLDSCEIPGFLWDYVYIDWRKGKTEAVEAILRALKQVSLKPSIPNEESLGLSFKEVVHTITFKEKRGKVALFNERFKGTTFRKINGVRRNLYFAGELIDVTSDMFDISRRAVTPHYEILNLKSKTDVPANTEIIYNLDYEIRECFGKEKELWFYAIESPTDKVTLLFDYAQSTSISHLGVKHRQGQTLLDEPVKPYRIGSRFIWEKVFPVYRDTYEFELEWAE